MTSKFEKWKTALAKTSKAQFGRIANLLGTTQITKETWDNLEALLIQCDLGIDTTQQIITSLQKRVHQEGLTQASELKKALRDELLHRLDSPPAFDFPSKPSVVLIVGVNGSGKTTSVAKLGKRYSNEGKRILLVTTDTYRAAAIEQLQILGQRLSLPVHHGHPGGDPGAVAYDALQSAQKRGIDLVLIDTAGRLHTRFNLLEELKKVHRVVGKALPGAPQAIWLVLDATTGQNAFRQAQAFKEAVQVNGIILAKLDTSARGGMTFAIQQELGIPVIFAGLGEKLDDLHPFDPEAFVTSVMKDF
ncbi:MAG: signal recognition particle-docking protein FtsY [Chloroflexota bacterium]